MTSTNRIDQVYIINLKRREDLWEKIKYLKDFLSNTHKIPVQRIEGIDFKYEFSKNPLLFNELVSTGTVSLNATALRNTKDAILGEIGCFLSHKKCWTEIANKSLQNTLILEDGIIFDCDTFSPLLDYGNFDILFANQEIIKENNKLKGYGFQAYIVSLAGAKKLLNLGQTLVLPIDIQIRNLCNDHQLNWNIHRKKFVRRDAKRVSSINSTNTLSYQVFNTLSQRILTNMIQKNIPIANYLDLQD